jgi:hypothetical protein
MILIFGVRSRARTVSTGTFFCPNCSADRHYMLQHIRKWFTLFFIPIFPVDKGSFQIVRCGTCNTAFRPNVLSTPTTAEFGDTLRGAVRVAAVAMLHAGDTSAPIARQIAVDAVREAGVENYQDEWLENDLDAVDITTLGNYLGPLASGLNAQGKETFVARIARIGLADGSLSDSETELLEHIGAQLDLSAAYIRGIIVTATNAPN